MQYHEFEHLMQQLELGLSPAELHGQLIGAFVSQPHFSFQYFLEQVEQFSETSQVLLTTEIAQPLAIMCAESIQALAAEQYELDLFLPDDTESLASRLAAISDWARGFLTGVGLSGVSDKQLTGELKESLEDLQQITTIDTGVIENMPDALDTEREAYQQQETAYSELVEHLRLAAFLWQANNQKGSSIQPGPDATSVPEYTQPEEFEPNNDR